MIGYVGFVFMNRYTDKLRIFRTFDFGKIRDKVEPVRYNVGRETLPWSRVKNVLEVEAASMDRSQ